VVYSTSHLISKCIINNVCLFSEHRYIELFLNSVPGNRSDGMYGNDGFAGDEDMDMMGGGGMQGGMQGGMMRKGTVVAANDLDNS